MSAAGARGSWTCPSISRPPTPAMRITHRHERQVRGQRDDLPRQDVAGVVRATAEQLDWSSELDRLDLSYREVVGAEPLPERSREIALS